ncbi:MAG: hypothetical protein R3E86_03320 [Pseudomonadales bacterium]
MQEEERKQQRDDIRCDAALQTIEDVLWRFNESNEGTLSVYDVIGYLVEDLVKEGFCAACINDTVLAAFQRSEADLEQHNSDDGTPLTRGSGDVYH